MAITISHSLLPVHFSRNACDIEFTALDKFDTLGQLRVQILRFTDFPEDGDTMLIEWTKDAVDYSFTLTFATTPDLDEYEVNEYDTPTAGWIGEVVTGLLAHPDFSQHFTFETYITETVNGIKIKSLYETTSGVSITSTGFATVLATSTAGAITDAKDSYRLSAWLFIGNTSSSDLMDMQHTGEIELDTDASGLVKLNLQRYLDAYLTSFETPTDTTGAFILCGKINRPAFVLYGQKWNSPYERQKQFRSPTFRALKGGMEEREFGQIKSTIVNTLKARFLTLRYARKINFDGQKDWLFFFTSGIPDAEIKVTTYRAIAGIATSSIFTDDLSSGTYQFRCDYDALITTTPGSEAIYKYEVQLFASGGALTPKVSFTPDSNYLDVVFEFENSLGAIESWKMTGESAQLAQINKQLYETAAPFNTDGTTATLKSYGELVGKTLDCTTGPLSATDAVAFADFLRARHVWLRTADQRIPVRLSGGTTTQATRNLKGDYTRTGKFTAQVSLSANVSPGSVI